MAVEQKQETTLALQSLDRVTSWPIVSKMWGFATTKYNGVKEYNGIVNYTLTRAEKTISYVADTAKPIVTKFERQISFADSLACQGIDVFEKQVTVVKSTIDDVYASGLKKYEDAKKVGTDKVNTIKDYGTERVNNIKDYGTATVSVVIGSTYGQAVARSVDYARNLTSTVVDQGWKKYEDVKKIGTDRVNGMKEYGTNQVSRVFGSPYAQAIVKSVDMAMDLTENAVDHYLPAADDEQQVDAETRAQQSVVQRIGTLSEKMRRRVYKQVIG